MFAPTRQPTGYLRTAEIWAETATRGVIGVWDVSPEIGWLGLRLGIKLSEIRRSHYMAVEVVLDLVDPLLREHGGDATLASVWSTLAERAFEHYSVERFAQHIEMVLLSTKGTIGWRQTLVPSRVATLIQRFSERDPELDEAIARTLLKALDMLVDMGDRRAAAIQTSEVFRRVKVV